MEITVTLTKENNERLLYVQNLSPGVLKWETFMVERNIGNQMTPIEPG